MIEKNYGNMLQFNVEALINPVNCVGVMGKGLALAFKQAYPDNFLQYQTACRSGKVKLGQMFITVTNNDNLGNLRYIINFPTKQHWRDNSCIEDIQSGLVALVGDIKKLKISSVAIPALGCGLGGLDWKEVEPLIVDAFGKLPAIRVIVFPPKG